MTINNFLCFMNTNIYFYQEANNAQLSLFVILVTVFNHCPDSLIH